MATCENIGVKHILVLALCVAACGKVNDLPALKTEAEGIVKKYATRFDDLNRRADSIMQRGNAIGVTSPDAANASRMFAQSKGKLDELRTRVNGASAEIAKLAKNKNELRRYLDKTSHELKVGYIELNGDFDAVESWIAFAEANPSAGRGTPQPPPQ